MELRYLAIAGSFLNLLGGAVLSLDALRLKRRLAAQSGAEDFLGIIQSHGLAGVVTDEKGHRLDSRKAMQIWFAQRSQNLAWLGFVVMTLGFALDVASKWLG